MGSDKALVQLNGIPLVEIALGILNQAGATAQIAGSRTSLGHFSQEVQDKFTSAGPLAGVHSALSDSRARWNVFLPVDMPLMPPSLLACLLARARSTGSPVTLATLNGRSEPFPVVLDRKVVSILETRIQQGETACYTAWKAIPAQLNLPSDHVSAEVLAASGRAPARKGCPPFSGSKAPTPRLNCSGSLPSSRETGPAFPILN